MKSFTKFHKEFNHKVKKLEKVGKKNYEMVYSYSGKKAKIGLQEKEDLYG
jgi:hypothetical protein